MWVCMFVGVWLVIYASRLLSAGELTTAVAEYIYLNVISHMRIRFLYSSIPNSQNENFLYEDNAIKSNPVVD